MLHIEGMGVVGSFLAHTLRGRNIPFTWNDVHCDDGWKACSGMVRGDHFNMYMNEANYSRWLGDNAEFASGFALDRRGELFTTGKEIHFNVKNIVDDARNNYFFSEKRYDGKFPLAVAHKLTDNFRVTWSVEVELDFDNEILSKYRKNQQAYLRPSVSLPHDMFVRPLPRTTKFVFGSSRGYKDSKKIERGFKAGLSLLSKIAVVYSCSEMRMGWVGQQNDMSLVQKDTSISPYRILTSYKGMNDLESVIPIVNKIINIYLNP